MTSSIHGIKTYARRCARMTKAQMAMRDIHTDHLINIEQARQILHNPSGQRMIVDVGFGMGHSLYQQAKDYPKYTFLGIEVYEPGVCALRLKLNTQHLPNLHVLHGDATMILASMPLSCIDIIQCFFPDPWHKARHHKRRLMVQPTVMTTWHQLLKKDGYIDFVTDIESYAQHVMMQYAHHKHWSISNCHTNKLLHRPSTKYEQRAIRLGHDIHQLYLQPKR